jgi:hypothetical protein
VSQFERSSSVPILPRYPQSDPAGAGIIASRDHHRQPFHALQIVSYQVRGSVALGSLSSLSSLVCCQRSVRRYVCALLLPHRRVEACRRADPRRPVMPPQLVPVQRLSAVRLFARAGFFVIAGSGVRCAVAAGRGGFQSETPGAHGLRTPTGFTEVDAAAPLLCALPRCEMSRQHEPTSAEASASCVAVWA